MSYKLEFPNKINSAEPDEMVCYAAFHLGLHCKSSNLGVTSTQRVN